MKIGILTVPFNNNYGGYLQSYALMTVLKKMGHKPTLIMRRHNPRNYNIVFFIKYFIKGIVMSVIKGKRFPCKFSVEGSYYTQGKNMQTFVNKYIQPQTKFVYSDEELIKECEGKFDVYIVGSDQVWRAVYVPNIVGNMFLDFTEGWEVKRLAYAASFGTDNPEYTDEEKEICGKLITNFDAVSVREHSGLQVFENFRWNANNLDVVLDPTLLLTKEDYNKFLPIENQVVKNKVFCYVLDRDDDSNAVIQAICQNLHKSLYEITDIQNGSFVLPSIETWLSAIRDSDFVITDSFHGTVFSIIYNKPFAVYVNKSRGAARFLSLLEQLGLENRVIENRDALTAVLDEEINWPIVNRKLEGLKCSSNKFIERNLK